MFGLLMIFSLIILTYLLLVNDKDITVSILKSYLLEDKYDKQTIAIFLALIFPITLFQYIYLKHKNKMSLKTLFKGLFIFVLLFTLFNLVDYTATELVTFNNTEIDLTTQFEQKRQERITFYDKMFKQASTTTEIALRNDSSFANIVNIVMTNQPQNLSSFLSAIHLIDPSANYEQVSQFYNTLLNITNTNREGFLQQEIVLQNINKEHNNLLLKFPGSLYNSFFKRNKFEYIPILSTNSQEVERTKTDNNYKLFK